jgi:adenosylcobinamide kinase / adenosylcobinamide-phosphate guanylyltransferase
MEHESQDRERVLAHADRLAELLGGVSGSVVLVSNEVGSGIVPDNEMARTYRDLLGGMNQRIAAAADEVVLLVAGCPLVIKQPSQVPA